MTNEELKNELKKLILQETLEEQKTILDGFKIGLLNNQQILTEIELLIQYYKDERQKK